MPPLQVQARRAQPRPKLFHRKVDRRERNRFRHHDPRRLEQLTLPRLSRRMVDLDDSRPHRQLVVVGEGVQAGPENHELPDPTVYRREQRVLGEAAAGDDRGPEPVAAGIQVMPAPTPDRVGCVGAQDRQRERVAEDQRVVVELMRGALTRHPQCRLARSPLPHRARA